MLIRDVDIGGAPCSVRIRGGQVLAIAPTLPAEMGEPIVDGGGGALLPGLHDHHIHLFAAAAARSSVDCGPPLDAAGLARRLRGAAEAAGSGWVRGVGYHDAVAGDLDRDVLDACMGNTPARIQHCSGRLWVFNSAALDRLLGSGAEPVGYDPFERQGGRLTGRLYDGDEWLKARLASQPPDLAGLSTELARRGVTGVTDTGHANDLRTYAALGEAQRRGEILQDLLVFGGPDLDRAQASPGIRAGAVKFHLHDNAPPDPADFTRDIARAHDAGRNIAVHCVTVADLVITLACLADAGARRGDRIEHASLVPPDLVDWIAALGVTVVTQPHFIAERGDGYLRDLDPAEIPWLYRAGSLIAAGVPIAAGSDAPYGKPDPWASMQAAVDRRTASGVRLGEAERLTPEQALALYSGGADAPGEGARRLQVGMTADLCLLDRPWAAARRTFGEVAVNLTLKAGRPIWTAPALEASACRAVAADPVDL